MADRSCGACLSRRDGPYPCPVRVTRKIYPVPASELDARSEAEVVNPDQTSAGCIVRSAVAIGS
jgi:hypothetical protein